MIDGHIHVEYGPYTLEWIDEFVKKAEEMDLTEIRLLEHNYMFPEFSPMYDSVRAASDFVNSWFERKAAYKKLPEYLALIEEVRKRTYPVTIKFGLEVCYFEKWEDLIYTNTKDLGLDFLLGSMHFVGDFAFDHTAELWEGIDVDSTYQKYFEDSVKLADSGLFNGIGHPDTIKLFGHKPSFSLTEYYEKLAQALQRNGMYADQNSGAHRRCPDTASLGMDPELIRILKAHHVPIITSSDAHKPEDVGDHIKEMENLLEVFVV